MKILITGSSGGIGKAAAKRFLSLGHTVYGLDRRGPAIDDPNYIHFSVDIKNASDLPDIPGIGVIFSNAGTQNDDDIGNNLKGAINVVEKYIENNDSLVSVLFNASASSLTGQEFPV